MIVLDSFIMSFPEQTRAIRRCDNGLYWYNSHLRDMRETYVFLQDLYNKYKINEFLPMRHSYWTRYRHAIDDAEKSACSSYINKSKNKSKAMWKLINGSEKKEIKLPDNVNINDFNHFFVNMATSVIAHVPDSLQSNYVKITDSVFSLRLVSPIIIRDILLKMKNSSTKDVYDFSPIFIKKNISLFVTPLTKLVNLSLETATFPDALKIARVVPIHKKGDKNDYGNYRPICILPVFSKGVLLMIK